MAACAEAANGGAATALALLSRLRALGVVVSVEDGRLCLDAARGVIDDALRADLVAHKTDLLALLSSSAKGGGADTIGRADRDRPLPLSFAQERLWFLDQLDPDSPAYNVTTAQRLRGPLDIDALQRTLHEIIARHEALRTVFPAVDDVPSQRILENAALPLEIERLDGDAAAREALARDRTAAEKLRPFDLARGPIVRARLLELAPEDHVLVVTVHHIAVDGWSARVLQHELWTVYEAFRAGRPSPLEPLPLQYADYAAWQRTHLDDAALARHLEWWKTRLADVEPLELPTDHPRPPVQDPAGGRHRHIVARATLDALRRLARDERASVFMVCLAAFQVLLRRYSGQTDIVVGTPVANRERAEFDRLIGFFSNSLALRGDLSGRPSFRALLRATRAMVLGGFAHQAVPFESLVHALQPQRDRARNPIFQVFFAQLNVDVVERGPSDGQRAGARPGGLAVTPFGHAATTTHFDLEFDITEAPTGLVTDVVYAAALFEPRTIERMARHYETLLASIAADPDRSIDDLDLMDATERRALLVARNDTATAYPDALTVPGLVARAAADRPGQIAVRDAGAALTYGELQSASNRLARHLTAAGVGRGDRVGLMVERSAAMLVGLLGIQKTGAAYVPLDPGLPEDRLRFMREDAALATLVNNAMIDEAQAGRADDPLPGVGGPDDIAYVIYTSGSTGRPKGVEVRHRGVVNFLESMRREPGFGPEDALLAVTTLSFDIAGLELLLPIIAGGSVVIAPSEAAANGETLAALLDAHGITVMQGTPATWQLLVQSGWAGRPGLRMLCGGEALPRPLADALIERGGELWNMYGPTETTIWSATTRVGRDEEGPIHIGHPIANTQLYVMDERGRPVPDGALGELWIGGDGVARGYFRRPELTAERFVPDPFGPPGATAYRTGDLVRYDSEGRLLFLGRADHQIKLRGFRIELGEIEAALDAHPDVHRSAVLVRDERLVAFLVAAPTVTSDALRRHLSRSLPDYMVPGVFVTLEAMPLSPAGKIDRRRLTGLEPAPVVDADAVAPRTPSEEAVATAIGELLDRPAVGAHDNFFALGGHSLLATRLVSRLRGVFRIELPLSAVFAAPTVAGLAARIDEERRGTTAAPPRPPIEPVPRGDRPALSFAQRRLWFLDQLGAGKAYNIQTSLRATGHLVETRVRAVLRAITDRHEILRTTYPDEAGQPYQHIAPSIDVPLACIDLSQLEAEAAEREAVRCACSALDQPFDLARGPVLRATLIRMPEDDVLVVAVHHIACDGWSLLLLGREIAAHHAALEDSTALALPALPVQYADFAAWQSRWLDEEAQAGQLEYWKRQLAGLPVLELRTDRPRPAVRSPEGASCAFAIPPALYQALKALTRARGVTTAMTMLAVFDVLLARYTGQDDIVVGSPVAGRSQREIEELIGFFVNTVVMRTDLSGDPSFENLLARVQKTALEAYDHQDLPFERLVDELAPERSLEQNPLYQVVFAMQHDLSAAPGGGPARFRGFPTDVTVTRTDLELHLFEGRGGIRGRLVYNTDLFDAATIERMVGHYVRLLETAIDDPAAPVSALPLLDDEERRSVLEAWNDTERPYPAGRCLHELIEDRVRERPRSTAVVFGETTLSYAELNTRANRVAHVLREMGVGPDMLVGLCVDRGPDMIVALLGILKAGGAYVPLDPAYPSARLAFMIADCGAPVLVTQRHLAEALPPHEARVLAVEDVPADGPCDDLPPLTTPDHLAYAIYTSGSTGRPKCALLAHRGLVSLSEAQRRAFHVTPESRVLQFASLSFDACTFEIVMALPKGAALHLGTREALQPGPDLLEFLRSRRITIVTLPPTALAATPLSDLPDLATITVAGEACSAELAERWAGGRRFFNLYGPTEATIWTTMAELRPDGGRVTIGRPIDNVRVYVVDRHLRPVPVGVPGELLIGGLALARGYHGRAALTAERFVPDPFAPGGRLYRTGDLVRYRVDGRLEFLGRIDDQVKVRGFRIELGEIERILEQHAAVRDAVAIVRDDRIVAYVVEDEHEPDDADETLVSHWRSLYDETYAEIDSAFAGWNSSYDGQPIATEQMQEWLDRTVEAVLESRPQRVLELGCGAGLILFGVAPHCRRYVGTDFARTAIEGVAGRLTSAHDHVALQVGGADEFVGAADETFDTIVLNSVVQYFPSAEYLRDVLGKAIAHTRPGGRIFVGDVRSLPLLRAFHASVELERAPADLETDRLSARIDRSVEQDQELLVDPALFFGLDGVGAVEIRPKRGAYDNELSRFRYDVVLHVGADGDATPVGAWREWTSVADLEQALGEGPAELAFHGVPDGRIHPHVKAVEALEAGDGPATAGDLRRYRQTVRGVDLEALQKLASDHNYKLYMSLGGIDQADIVLRPAADPARPLFPRAWADPADGRLTNDPRHGRRRRSLVGELRDHARGLLPEHMVPVAFVRLDRLPVTPNGKVDRRALPDPESARPDVSADYTAPRTDAERKLAAAWAQVLGVERVGTRDNFFELGGDSIQSVQVVAAAREAGLAISARDLFLHQTVATLAAAATEVVATAAEEGPLIGPVPLLPIQSWFLEQDLLDRHHFNQTVLFAPRERIDPGALREVLAAMVDHHDALRLRLRGDVLEVEPPGAPVALDIFDDDAEAFITARATRLQASLDLERGPIVKAALFRQKLFITAHHLAIDGVSWRILLDDLERGLRAVAGGEPVVLPPRTASIATWARRLDALAQDPALVDEAAYWLQRSAAAPLPRDLDGDNTVGSIGHVTVGLDAGETTALLQQVPAAYGTRINDALLTALVEAIGRWTGAPRLVVDLEGHGRTGLLDDVDLSRTVGWFTSMHPVHLDVTGARAPGAALKRVKEQLRAVPREGLVYGLLRYLCRDASVRQRLAALPAAEVSFNYLGQLDATWGRDAAFSRAAVPLGPSRAPGQRRAHALEINGLVREGQLALTFAYSRQVHHEATVRAVAEDYLGALRDLIAHCRSPETGGFTPSDFAELDIAQTDLDDILAEVDGGVQ